jgi:hypothetical protein
VGGNAFSQNKDLIVWSFNHAPQASSPSFSTTNTIQFLPPAVVPVTISCHDIHEPLADLSAARSGALSNAATDAKPQISLLPMTMKTLRLANINTRINSTTTKTKYNNHNAIGPPSLSFFRH